MSGSPLPILRIGADAGPHLRFRCAGPDDAETVASIHYRSARQAYRGVLPDSVISDMTFERRLALWGGLLGEAGRRPRVSLALEPGEAEPDAAVAFSWWRAVGQADADFGGEVVALYVHPDRQRRGIGRRLLAHTAQAMKASGLDSVYLWAFEQHHAARAFYEALGGRAIDRDWEVLGALRVPRIAYAWKPIDRLLEGEAAAQGGRQG